MDATESLRDTLESMTKVYHEKNIPVRFGSPSRAVPEGRTVQGEQMTEPTVVVDPEVNEKFQQQLSGPEELRMLTNTLSHELEHIRESRLTSKTDFMKTHEGHPNFAGGVINILEDQYIDFTRTQRFPGLRSTQAFVIETLLEDDDRWPPVDSIEDRPKAMLEGVRQVAFAGHAKGIDAADEWLREFLSRIRPHTKRIRREESQPKREEIASAVMGIAEEYLPENKLDMPDICAVCGDRSPDIITPMLGPVCKECAPLSHNTRGEIESTEEKKAVTDGLQQVPDTGCVSSENEKTDPEVDQASDLERTGTDTSQVSSEEGQRESVQTAPDGSDGDSGQIQADELTAMDALARDRDVGAWWDVPDHVDHQAPTEQDVARYERIQAEEQKRQSIEADLRRQREAVTGADRGISPDCVQHSDNLRSEETWRQFRDDLHRTFRNLTSRDMAVPTRSGTNLNMDAIVQRAAGDVSRDKLYTQKQTVARGDRLVAVSADMSGSMNGRRVKLALAAIAEATSMVGDTFLATCWTDGSLNSSGYVRMRGSTRIGLICGSDEQFQWEQLNAFQSGGGTPTADGIDITRQMIQGSHGREKLMIVITDGRPNGSYSGDEDFSADPVTGAAQVVQDLQSKNIQVIGLYVGRKAEETAMAKLFGEDGFVSASMDELAEELIKIYRRQLRV